MVALYFIYYQLALMAGGSGRVRFKIFYGQILRALIEGYGWLLLDTIFLAMAPSYSTSDLDNLGDEQLM